MRRRPPAYVTIVLLLLSVALTIISAILQPKPDIEDARPAGLGDFNFPTATEGRAIPVVWGSVKIAGPNVTWYGDLLVSPIKEKIDGGLFGGTTRFTVGYRYYVGLQLAICHGVVDELYRIEVSEQQVFPLDAQVPLTATTQPVVINKPNIFGGDSERGGIVGEFEWYTGTTSIANGDMSQYLADMIGSGSLDNIPAFLNTTYLVWRGPTSRRIVSQFVAPPTQAYPNGQVITVSEHNGYIGTQTTLEAWAFYVRRFPNGLGLGGGQQRIGDDANPMAVLYEIMTNTVWGLGIPGADIDAANFQAAGATLATEGNGFSLVWTDQRPARELISEIMRQIHGSLTQTAGGLYRVKLIRTPTGGELSAAFVFDPTNVLELTEFTRGAWNQTFNHIQINYQDRNDSFKETSAVEQDLANFTLQGNREAVAASDWPGVKVGSVARQIAKRELLVRSFPLAKIKLSANRECAHLLPGDIAKLTWPELGITDMVLRILSLDLGELGDGRVDVTAMEDAFGLGYGGFASPPATGWDPIDVAATDAGAIVFPMPGIIAQQRLEDQLNDSRIMALVPRSSGPAVGVIPNWNIGNPATSWGPYHGTAEPSADAATGFCPTAQLTAALLARQGGSHVVSSITVDTATVDFVEKVLKDFIAADAAGLRTGRNLIMIGGVGGTDNAGYTDLARVEFMAFESLTDNGNGTYTLNNVHRGLGDTVPWDHPDNSLVYFLDADQAYHLTDNDTLYPGWSGSHPAGSDLVTDTRIQVQTPFSLSSPSTATQRRVFFRAQVDNTVDLASRIFMPLPPFGVGLLMDPSPAVAATAYFFPGDATQPASPATVAGLTAALNCRVTWKNRGRFFTDIKLPNDATDTMNATNEPGEYPVSAPAASTAWEVQVTVTGHQGGTTVIHNTAVTANTGLFDFTLPAVNTQNSGLISIKLRARRVDGAGVDSILSRTAYTIWFSRI